MGFCRSWAFAIYKYLMNCSWFRALLPADLVAFTGADEEAFEDNPEEYIRRDLEGSGIHRSLANMLTVQQCVMLIHSIHKHSAVL